jgi:dTMP kinase
MELQRPRCLQQQQRETLFCQNNASIVNLKRAVGDTVSRGLLVTLSGIESSGKSTQLKRLEEDLRGGGRRPPIQVWIRPGYTRNLEALKRLSGSRSSRPAAGEGSPRPFPRRAEGFRSPLRRRLWLSLALIDLIWVFAVQVRYWRAMGRTVICDRYLWDCLVDFRVNFPDDPVERWLLGRALTALTPDPDIAFFLLIPVDESLRRSDTRERRFRESPAVLERRLAEYESQAGGLGWPVLDGRRPVEELAEEIRMGVAQAAGSAGKRGA